MNFLWPELAWLLLLAPALVAFYLWMLRRRKRHAMRYANLAMVKQALAGRSSWRRHLPPLLFLLGFATLLIAVMRPTARMTLPSQHQTVVLAIDVSGSMRANDVAPSRLAAADAAARAFIMAQPRTTRLGLVSFAGTASLVQVPTHNRDDILAAMDRFQLQHGTAVGSGLLVALKAIFPDMEFNLRSTNPRMNNGVTSYNPARPIDRATRPDEKIFTPVAPGSYASAAIILLSDGQTTTGPDPIEAAKMAAERGVRVYTVGIGTPDGEIVGAEGWSMRVRLDEETLRGIAATTQAEYFFAGNANELTRVYQKLNTQLALETKDTEISALFAALGGFLILLGAMLSLFWHHRVL